MLVFVSERGAEEQAGRRGNKGIGGPSGHKAKEMIIMQERKSLDNSPGSFFAVKLP